MIAPVLKTGDCDERSVGSNPTPSSYIYSGLLIGRKSDFDSDNSRFESSLEYLNMVYIA